MDETEADETARAQQAAQVILDGVGSIEPADGEEVISDSMQLAFARLVEIGAIEILVGETDEDGEVEFELDIAPVLGGIQLVIGHLVDEVSRYGGISREDVLAATRDALAR